MLRLTAIDYCKTEEDEVKRAIMIANLTEQ